MVFAYLDLVYPLVDLAEASLDPPVEVPLDLLALPFHISPGPSFATQITGASYRPPFSSEPQQRSLPISWHRCRASASFCRSMR